MYVQHESWPHLDVYLGYALARRDFFTEVMDLAGYFCQPTRPELEPQRYEAPMLVSGWGI